MSRSTNALFAALLVASAMGGAACAGAPPARIQQGEVVTTGDATYDAFFKQVVDTREKAERAEKSAEDARADLAKVLELDAKAATGEAIVEQMIDRAKKLRERGVLLHLELTPDAKLISVISKPIDPWGEDMIKAVEESAKKSLALVRELAELSSRAAALQKTRSELRDKASATFGDRAPGILRELNASEAVIDDAAELGSKHAGITSSFVIALAAAVETGAGGGSGGKGPSRLATGKSGGRAQGKTQGSSSGPTTPVSVPARKPKPKSDDFEP